MREISASEVNKLEICLRDLADYHNEKSINFKGKYPKRPFDVTLDMFRADILNGKSRIIVIENADEIAGFCKIDIIKDEGKIDYLIVLKKYRTLGMGKQLMDSAMGIFKERGIRNIEVKVADGNDAMYFYEKYGFKMNAHILKLQAASTV